GSRKRFVDNLEDASNGAIDRSQAAMIMLLTAHMDNEYGDYLWRNFSGSFPSLGREMEYLMYEVMDSGRNEISAKNLSLIQKLYQDTYENSTSEDYETFMDEIAQAQTGGMKDVAEAFYSMQTLFYYQYVAQTYQNEVFNTILAQMEASLGAIAGFSYSRGKVTVTPRSSAKGSLAQCSCFVAGTKVMTDEGEKNIEDIEVGDKVLSKDETTGEVAYKEVTA
ncbi:Hint domain-containing protein, partial [Cohnella fermenti]